MKILQLIKSIKVKVKWLYISVGDWASYINIILNWVFYIYKINTKNKALRQCWNRRISRLSSLSLIKLLSIKVKNVKKAKEIVNINITTINKFLFNKANII